MWLFISCLTFLFNQSLMVNANWLKISSVVSIGEKGVRLMANRNTVEMIVLLFVDFAKSQKNANLLFIMIPDKEGA